MTKRNLIKKLINTALAQHTDELGVCEIEVWKSNEIKVVYQNYAESSLHVVHYSINNDGEIMMKLNENY